MRTYTQDGVCLTESGLSQLQSLANSASRRRRTKPKLTLKIINQNSVAVLQTPPDPQVERSRDVDLDDARGSNNRTASIYLFFSICLTIRSAPEVWISSFAHVCVLQKRSLWMWKGSPIRARRERRQERMSLKEERLVKRGRGSRIDRVRARYARTEQS